MKKIILTILIFTAVLFSSCEAISGFLGFDASIKGVTSDCIVGDPVIDPDAKTVIVTVEPMDIAFFEPEFTLSDGAEITPPDNIADGEPAVFTVTSSNGTVVEWTVTVNVQYGVSFIIDGTKTILLGGYKHSTDSAFNTSCGNGVPGVMIDHDRSIVIALEEVYDWATTSGEPDFDYVELIVEGVTTGTWGSSFSFYNYNIESHRFDVSSVVTEFDEIGGNFTATFSGSKEPSRTISISGFAKLKVVEHLGLS